MSYNYTLENIYLVPTNPLKGCGRIENHFELKGNIALSERGECSFVSKAMQAQDGGASGLIVINHKMSDDEGHIIMLNDPTARHIHIPTMFLQYSDGRMILNTIRKYNLKGARIRIPVNYTNDNVLAKPRTRGFHSI